MQNAIAFNNLAPLGVDQLRRQCPAVFAKNPHEDVSKRYGFVDTAHVLTALEKEGFVTVEARMYQKHKDRNYAKHMLRLRRAGAQPKMDNMGGIVPQVILVNSHDRTSPFQLYGGIFRLVCSNGLMVSTSAAIQPVRVRHTNRVVEETMAHINRIAADAAKVTGIIERMQHTAMKPKAQVEFARQALVLRCPDDKKRANVNSDLILAPRREEDKGNDVWSVFNRVQENIIKGGVLRTSPTGRTTTSGAIVSLDRDLRVNGGMWELAMAAMTGKVK